MSRSLAFAIAFTLASCQFALSQGPDELKRRPAPPLKVDLPVPRVFKQLTKASVEEVTIELLGADVGKTPLKRRALSGLIDLTSDTAKLNIKVSIRNDGANALKYLPWHSHKSTPLKATDEHGRNLAKIDLKVATWPDGYQEAATTIAAGKAIIDLIAIDAPGFNAEEIDLSIPGVNVGHPGKKFAFKIGRKFFEDEAKRTADIKERIRKATEDHEKKWNDAEDARIAAINDKLRDEKAAEVAKAKAILASKEKAGRTTRIGDMEICIEKSRLGFVLLPNGISTDKEFVAITVAISNLSETKLRWYEPWNAKEFQLKRSIAKMDDEFGNAYPNIYFTLGVVPVNQLRKKTRIDPDRTIRDIIIFDPPIDKANSFTIEFPGANLGATSNARIVVSRAFLLNGKE